jgi:hypothetical protein
MRDTVRIMVPLLVVQAVYRLHGMRQVAEDGIVGRSCSACASVEQASDGVESMLRVDEGHGFLAALDQGKGVEAE